MAKGNQTEQIGLVCFAAIRGDNVRPLTWGTLFFNIVPMDGLPCGAASLL